MRTRTQIWMCVSLLACTFSVVAGINAVAVIWACNLICICTDEICFTIQSVLKTAIREEGK